MSEHQGLPIPGYRLQAQSAIDLVTENKRSEEQLLRLLDSMKMDGDKFDQRWLAIARTHFEQAFMALNRSVFKPERVKLPGE